MMNKEAKWYYYYIKNYIKRYITFRKWQIMTHRGKVERLYRVRNVDKLKVIAKKKQMSMKDLNRTISEAIINRKPFWVGRFGGMERDVIISYLEETHGIKNEMARCIEGLCNNAGFFPKDEALVGDFVELMLESCRDMNVLGVWQSAFMEEYIISEYMKDTYLTKLSYIEPWMSYFSKEKENIEPWTHALKGKKVLVIHPFSETIELQYATKRTKIFEGFFKEEDILPQFELKTMKAVQTQGGEKDERFNTWFDALNWMKEEVSKIDFDVAIIGCGAYGFPLAAYIKTIGKVAIHMGGATQLLFGIKGKRWENTDGAKIFFNEYWVRPSKDEMIEKASSVEGGCYW